MRFLSASVKAILTSRVFFSVFTPLFSCASSIANALDCLDFCANVAIVNNLAGEEGFEPSTNRLPPFLGWPIALPTELFSH